MQMKHLIAGKLRQEAIKLLLSLPGIETATLEGDGTPQLPKSFDAIHLRMIVPNSQRGGGFKEDGSTGSVTFFGEDYVGGAVRTIRRKNALGAWSIDRGTLPEARTDYWTVIA